jgi:hypothetical protein
MTNFKFLFSALVSLLASSQSFATSPMMPYIPAEAFSYRCDVTVESYYYRTNSGEPGKQWTSKATLEINNNEQFLQGDKLNWSHTYAESRPELPFMPEGDPIAQSAHVNDTTFAIRFDYPENGVTNVNLLAMMYAKQNGTTVHSSAEAFGTFSDKRLGTQAETSRYTDKSGVSTSKKLTIRCERVK